MLIADDGPSINQSIKQLNKKDPERKFNADL